MKKFLLSIFFIVFMTFLLQFLSGVHRRNKIIQKVSSGARLEELINDLGPPLKIGKGEVFPKETLEIFQNVPYEKEMIYAFWSKEGLPYWWIIAVVSPPSNFVVFVQLRVAKWWGGGKFSQVSYKVR